MSDLNLPCATNNLLAQFIKVNSHYTWKQTNERAHCMFMVVLKVKLCHKKI